MNNTSPAKILPFGEWVRDNRGHESFRVDIGNNHPRSFGKVAPSTEGGFNMVLRIPNEKGELVRTTVLPIKSREGGKLAVEAYIMAAFNEAEVTEVESVKALKIESDTEGTRFAKLEMDAPPVEPVVQQAPVADKGRFSMLELD